VERRRKEAKRRDTECAEIRRRDRNRFRGKGAADRFGAPFEAPFGPQGKQDKQRKPGKGETLRGSLPLSLRVSG